MQPFAPKAPSKSEVLIAELRARNADSLAQTAANEIERLRDREFLLAKRIHMQRIALRENWQIIEMRASHRRAWYRSPLLLSMLRRGVKQPTPWWRRVFH